MLRFYTFHFFFYILAFIKYFKLFFIKCNSDIYSLNLENPVAFTLLNKNIIVFSNEGFYTFDPNLLLLYNYTFSTKYNRIIYSKTEFPFFTQFLEEEGGYVLCLLKNNIYFFNSDGFLLNSTIINDNENNYYVINAFKRIAFDYYFTFIKLDFSEYYGRIYLFYYKINISNYKLTLIYNNTYENENELISQTWGITCQKMISNINNNYLTCFYQYHINEKFFIGEISFEPDKNFTYIEPRKFYRKYNLINNVYYVRSTNNGIYTRSYVCYAAVSENASCFYYDINNKEFSQEYTFGYKCKAGFEVFNLNYFKEKNEFIFSCVDGTSIYSIVKFKENMEIIQPNYIGKYKPENCYSVSFFSIIYSLNFNEYYLFTRDSCQTESKIRIYILSNFFNSTTNSEINIDNLTTISNLFTSEIIKSTDNSDLIKSSNIIQSSELTIISEKIISEVIENKTSTEMIISNQISEYTGNNESNKIIWSNEINNLTEIVEIINVNISTEIIESTYMNELYEETNKINEKDNQNIYENICKDNKKIIDEHNNCICNNEKGYYSLYTNNIYLNNDCYNNETKPSNFYLNIKTKLFEMCHKYCATCKFPGNENENNCTSCIHNYIFMPDFNNTSNCVPLCNYYYYYNIYDLYSCTDDFQCPREYNLLIRKKNKCIDNCSKDNIYKYQYSGECFEKCPNDTNINNYKCEVKNKNECSLGTFYSNLEFNDLINNKIDLFAKNYVEEFNYTNNQIINYTNKEYSLVLYKNSSCIKELSLTIPHIDFSNCYKKIQLFYNISEDLLISVLDKYTENRNPISSYILFNPSNGEKINTREICKDEIIVVKENVLTLSGINASLVKFFASQNINVFNASDKFYSDICIQYKLPDEKDIPLKLRFKMFFPNISLCDEDCLSKGVDLKAMESICYCPFKEFTENSFFLNAFEYSDTLGKMYSFISNSNIDILLCVKKIFVYENFKRCTGGFFIMILIFFNTICVIIYFKKSKNHVRIYIFNILNLYIQIEKTKNEPPKKRNLNTRNRRIITNIDFNNENKKNSLDLNSSSINNINSFNNKNFKKKRIKSGKNSENIYISKLSNQNIIQIINSHKYINEEPFNPSKASNYKTCFNEYLSTDPNDMDFEDILERDKRTFCEYFLESMKNNQLIVNSFFIKDNIKPKSIKIIFFLLYLNFYCLINGLMYSEEYITELYDIENENFFNFISRIMAHIFYISVINKVLKELIYCLFIQEKKLKGILIRGKDRIKKIKEDIQILIKKIETNYLIFIIISYIIFAFSWVYISCFNDIYYYTRKDWYKSTFVAFIIIEIILILINLIEAIIRFIGIFFKSEKLFKLSKYID